MSNSFTIAVTGQSLIKHDTRGTSNPTFQEVCEIIKKADLAFTNFEGTIAGRYGGWPLKGRFSIAASPPFWTHCMISDFKLSHFPTIMRSIWAPRAYFQLWKKSSNETSCMLGSGETIKRLRDPVWVG